MPDTTKAQDVMPIQSQEQLQKLQEDFYNRFTELVQQYGIEEYAAVFKLPGAKSPIMAYRPDIIRATFLLKNAHAQFKSEVLSAMGETLPAR